MSSDRTLSPEIVAGFATSRVVVFGDIMLDRFVFGEVDRISPEAPIPVMRSARCESMLGGAGNLARNVTRLGGHASLIGIVGTDNAGEEIVAAARRERNLTSALIQDETWSTVVKTRFLARSQHLLRVDEEKSQTVGGALGGRLLSAVDGALRDATVLVCSDYAKGVVTPDRLRRVIDMARAHGCDILVDPKGRDFARYAGATVVTPNAFEAEQATGIPCGDDDGAARAAEVIGELTGSKAVVITRGALGMTVLTRDDGLQEITHVPTEAKDVRDVSGAGDTVLAVLALALSTNMTIHEAARLANIAAGIAVGKVGTTPVEAAELARALQLSVALARSEKIADLDAVVSMTRAWKAKGERIVFTNGCFDLLHPGHVRLLTEAKRCGDRLIVAINSDASVRRLKGPDRPIQHECARATIMSSIGVVDAVTVFADDTPLSVIEAIRPDVLVKGADYAEHDVVGGEFVKASGGRVILIGLEDGQSTSNILRRASR